MQKTEGNTLTLRLYEKRAERKVQREEIRRNL